MPRFTPWYSGVPPDPVISDGLVREVVQASLRRAYPLPTPEQDREERFCDLLDGLRQVRKHMPEGRSSRPGP
jgi:hypothetical protein